MRARRRPRLGRAPAGEERVPARLAMFAILIQVAACLLAGPGAAQEVGDLPAADRRLALDRP